MQFNLGAEISRRFSGNPNGVAATAWGSLLESQIPAMTTQEALQAIRKRSGLPTLSYWQLRYLIKQGHIPAPSMNASWFGFACLTGHGYTVKFLKEREAKETASA